MIVKVQISTATNIPGGPHVLVYNESRSIEYEAAADEAILDVMDGRPKAFFHAHLNETKKLIIDKEADWQTW